MALFADLEDDPAVGGKARSLAVLHQVGLPTPTGFVVTDALFRALRGGGPPMPGRLDAAALATLDAAAAALRRAPWPAGFLGELSRHLGTLEGARFAVRSSFAAEDTAGATAPGIYQSRLDVAAEAVPAAIREVLGSALAPGAVAYCLERGWPPTTPPVAVLVHPFLPGDSAGSAALDPSGPGEATPLVTVREGLASMAIIETLTKALHTLASHHGAVELEWVARGTTVTFLQLRPYRTPRAAGPWRGFSELPEGESPARWRWDAVHNPLPLSPAQAGLVALVEEQALTGVRQRVLGGYLFVAAGDVPPSAVTPEEASRLFEELEQRTESQRAALGESPDLEAALALFLAVYQPLFGVIQPAIRRGREALASFLRAHAPGFLDERPFFLSGVESRATERRRRAHRLATAAEPDRPKALAEYLALFGEESHVWDVVVPTSREAPEALVKKVTAGRGVLPPAREIPLSWRAIAEQVSQHLPGDLRDPWKKTLATARSCAALAEDDDWLYARAQAVVRRALLALGRKAVERGELDQPDDVFFIPLPVNRAAAASSTSIPRARALARAGRQALEAARQNPPPDLSPATHSALLRGAGTGGRALGRAWWPERLASDPPPADAILVAITVLPTELPLLQPLALVTETGGPLDHVAAQARERGLPAVVGVAGARAALPPGTLVLVDADRGLVVPLGGP